MDKAKRGCEKAAELVRDAGGKIIGRTKLQRLHTCSNSLDKVRASISNIDTMVHTARA
jgi:hypothetical protein